MSQKFATVLAGARSTAPMLLGVVPFGLICGAVFVNAGMPEWGASLYSLIVVAGASQLTVVQLLTSDASVAVAIATGLVVNMRMFMYSASLAPHFNGYSVWRKAFMSFFLTDQAYAVSINRFTESDGESVDKTAYYCGAGIFMWACFNISTLVGAFVGAMIPAQWNLDFAIPLTFIALVIPAVKDRPTLLSACVAGGVALIADPLPYSLGLMIASVIGIVLGYIAERRLRHV